MLYHSWDMMCDKCNCYFSFWVIFCPSTLVIAQKIKIKKKLKKQKHLEISSLYIFVPKIMITWYTVPEYGVQWMDGWKKWHIEVGVPPKNDKKLTDCVQNVVQSLFWLFKIIMVMHFWKKKFLVNCKSEQFYWFFLLLLLLLLSGLA